MISGFNGVFRDDDDARAVYSESAGIARIRPRGVAVPTNAEDVQALVRWARATNTPLIPRGSGSSMSSAAVGDGVVVDLSRLNQIGAVDVSAAQIQVGPGALRGAVDAVARAVGLQFPPDPSSGAFCTIGGMISTNAAGSHTLKYGATRPWVAALDCVFDDGTRATITRGAPLPEGIAALDRMRAVRVAVAPDGDTSHTRLCKDSSGYALTDYARSGELIDVLVGSEGTLAIIVGATLRLTEAPAATSSLLGAFPTLESAVTAATQARDAGAAACELLDRTFLDVAAKGSTLPHVPAGTEAVLLAETEGATPDDAARHADALARLFKDAGATSVELALTVDAEEELWELRHAVSPILATLGPTMTSMQFIEDGAVPPVHLAEYVRGIRKILKSYNVPGVIFGHAGDAHVHVNPLIDVGQPGWRGVVRQILDDVVTLTAQLDGTLTGEHGDGRLRTPLLSRTWSREAVGRFKILKEAFDPQGIFNPGVKVPLPDQHPVTDIKYDPGLPLHPAKAAAALALVAKERAYARFRLDLVGPP